MAAEDQQIMYETHHRSTAQNRMGSGRYKISPNSSDLLRSHQDKAVIRFAAPERF